ncbi:uncharacterized protein LOC134536612 [Bacillus rossius redtenbacheri]|uniref:uncharacterized protein LOC134536612 n=1 Tax=Bacillus rossius redtenbacheri TaxID=93214 RepID=UPI002FDD0FE9
MDAQSRGKFLVQLALKTFAEQSNYSPEQSNDSPEDISPENLIIQEVPDKESHESHIVGQHFENVLEEEEILFSGVVNEEGILITHEEEVYTSLPPTEEFQENTETIPVSAEHVEDAFPVHVSDSIADENGEKNDTESNVSHDVDYNKSHLHHFPGDSSFDSSGGENPEENCKTGRKSRGRKRKIEDQSRSERKRKRNSNQSYYNYKYKHVAHKVFEDYECHCPLQCNQKVGLEERKMEFDRFWKLGDYTAQNTYIGSLVTEYPKKRQYGRDPKKKQFSRIFRLSSVRVCRNMFCKTIAISPCRVNTALKKVNGRLPLNDQRGVQQGGWNKTSDIKLEKVIAHIKSVPTYTSHYCRDSVSSKYLPRDMTLEKMYSAYKSETEYPVSLATYKRVFYDKFDLKIKPLKKDTCNKCDTLHNQIQCGNENSAEVKEERQNHLQIATDAQTMLKSDMKLAKDCADIECLTYDMEKTLPLPRIPTSIMFYKRQLWLYNLGIHSGKDENGYCYVWLEGEAGRGAQEIGSCLRKHITSTLNSDVETLILWSDSCGGQNRNIKMVLMMKEILHNHPRLKKIILRYLVSGHSFLPNDRDFADIVRALKYQQRLYTPADYIDVMKTCRKKKPLIVSKMNPGDFLGTKRIEGSITNRKMSEDNRKVSWLNARQITLKREEPFLLYITTDFKSEDELVINIKKSTRGRPKADDIWKLIPLWPNGKPITAAKSADIESIKHLIPADAVDFYRNLTAANDAQEDDVDGFNNTLDFDIQE